MQCQIDNFVKDFVQLTGLSPQFDLEYKQALECLISYLSNKTILPLSERRKEFIAQINKKFRFNAKRVAELYAKAAHLGYTFNYHQKQRIQYAFDVSDERFMFSVFDERQIPSGEKRALAECFLPIAENCTLETLWGECASPTKLRAEKGARDIEAEIIKALFSSFMWVTLPAKEMHRYFDRNFSDINYRKSFWDELHSRSPQLFNRTHALSMVRITQNHASNYSSFFEFRDAICSLVQNLYKASNNYGFLAVLIEPIKLMDRSVEWELASDIILFAEKHRAYPLNKPYFRWKTIEQCTKEYIEDLDCQAAQFNLVNEGFTYRDCFALSLEKNVIDRILLLFQKNDRDETPIPCPTCRSADVQGNSYSSLGVRSWECNNLLCPDRSKYNRGKRYSFKALVMQQSIDDELNEIPTEIVRRWDRDVVYEITPNAVNEMILRHYSMHGDTVHTYDWFDDAFETTAREIVCHKLSVVKKTTAFWNGPFFKRYTAKSRAEIAQVDNLGDSTLQVISGDSASVLKGFPEGVFDGAVTSPPYYNAREYSQWKNIYCYLYDMKRVAEEVFRTLKYGAYYFYNIFDYFDNENSIALSDMGRRRMILSALSVDLFRRIGFELFGNIVWDKGSIEGKRGFNAGNYSPYYQAPFNCWEHLLMFRKPSQQSSVKQYNCFDDLVGYVLKCQPVTKIIRGENVHGHSAPFPDEIPELLISRLFKGAVVLDPFAGSLTTGRVAERYGLRSVCIEKLTAYCELGLKMRSIRDKQPALHVNELALI